MTEIDRIEHDFRRSVCADVRIRPEGKLRYRVFTPFRFDDGDRVALVLRNDAGAWVLSDEGNTFMRLSYRLDDRALLTEGRSRIISNALDSAGLDDRGGELVVVVDEGKYGEALYTLVQAVLRISDVSLLTREQVRSTFLEDLQELVRASIPFDRVLPKWNEPRLDPDARYPVDWFIRTPDSPLFIFALTSEDKVKDATITLHQFEKWEYPHKTVGVFQDQENISHKTLARFTDVADKNFSSFTGNETRIAQYLMRLAGVTSN